MGGGKGHRGRHASRINGRCIWNCRTIGINFFPDNHLTGASLPECYLSIELKHEITNLNLNDLKSKLTRKFSKRRQKEERGERDSVTNDRGGVRTKWRKMPGPVQPPKMPSSGIQFNFQTLKDQTNGIRCRVSPPFFSKNILQNQNWMKKVCKLSLFFEPQKPVINPAN